MVVTESNWYLTYKLYSKLAGNEMTKHYWENIGVIFYWENSWSEIQEFYAQPWYNLMQKNILGQVKIQCVAALGTHLKKYIELF